MHQLSRSKDLLDASQDLLDASRHHFPMDAGWLMGLGTAMHCEDSLCRLWDAITSFGPIATFSQAIGTMAGFVYYNYFVRQLARVYFLTPIVVGELGGWGGKTLPQICADLTKVQQSFWEKNIVECNELVEKRFLGILALVETVLILFCTYRMIYGIVSLVAGLWCTILSTCAYCWRRRPAYFFLPPTPPRAQPLAQQQQQQQQQQQPKSPAR